MNCLVKGTLGLIMTAISVTNSYGQDNDRAWLELQETDGMIAVQAFCETTWDGAVDYRLFAVKSGGSGTANSSQSGRHLVKKGEVSQLSVVRLGTRPGDIWEITLKLYKNGKLVAEDYAEKKEFL